MVSFYLSCTCSVCNKAFSFLKSLSLVVLFMAIGMGNSFAAGCPELSVTSNSASCFGSANGSLVATASGGVSPYKYSLNNAAYVNSGTFSNLAGGNYTIRVKDAANCITSGTFFVNSPTEIQANLSISNVICKGGSDGSIQMNMESVPPYLFKLNSGAFQSSNYFSGLPAGNYTVTVKDGNGCTKTLSGTVTQPATAVAIAATSTATICPGTATGSITVTGSSGATPYTYSIDGSNYQAGAIFNNLNAGTYTAYVKDANGCVASKSVTIANPAAQLCSLGYPDNSNLPRSAAVFNESEVLRAYDPAFSSSCSGIAQTIKMWYNDEHAMTLGVRAVSVKTASGTTTTTYPITAATTSAAGGMATYPAVGSTIASGDQSGNDIAVGDGRPLWPALFVTDITTNATSRSGDWQQGGTGIPPHRINGSWKSAVKLVDKTKNPVLVTVTPDADPPKNNWNMPGGDAQPAGLTNEGYGTEVVWNVADLNLIPGHTYHLQFMVHDGDQNKSGGDVGQGCTTIFVPGGGKTDPADLFVRTIAEDFDAVVTPNPFKNALQIKVFTGSDEPVDFKMYSLLGALIAEKQNMDTEYNLPLDEQLSAGVYLVEVKQGNHQKVIRLVKE